MRRHIALAFDGKEFASDVVWEGLRANHLCVHILTPAEFNARYLSIGIKWPEDQPGALLAEVSCDGKSSPVEVRSLETGELVVYAVGDLSMLKALATICIASGAIPIRSVNIGKQMFLYDQIATARGCLASLQSPNSAELLYNRETSFAFANGSGVFRLTLGECLKPSAATLRWFVRLDYDRAFFSLRSHQDRIDDVEQCLRATAVAEMSLQKITSCLKPDLAKRFQEYF